MRPRVLLASALILLSATAAAIILSQYGIGSVLAWIAAWRGAAAIPFVLIYALAAIALFPDSLLTIAAGAIFGLAGGLLLVSMGSMLGATLAFFLGRTLVRDWVHGRAAHWPKFQALDHAIARHGFWMVFLTRLSPVIPFGLLNYAYGITTVCARDYLIASWIGMLPGTLLYVYAGTAAANLTAIISGRAQIGQEGNILLWVGLVATITLIGLLTYFARRELARELRS